MSERLEILIYGVGAVGATLGWRLAQQSRCCVSAVCRSNYDVVKARGIQMQTKIWGNGALKPKRVVKHPSELRDMRFDYIICANKITGDTDFARDLGESVVDRRTTLVTTQNGLNPADELITRFPNNRVISSICYVACIQPTFGVVEQICQIRPHAFHFGLTQRAKGDCVGDMRDEDVLHNLVSMDDSFKVADQLESEVWAKLVWNGIWNPISALTGSDTHEILKTAPKSLIDTMVDMAKEIQLVGVASGAKLPKSISKDVITVTKEMPSVEPSMLQDVKRGNSMEVETLCGNIIRRGTELGIRTPTLRAIYGLLKQLNNNLANSKSDFVPDAKIQRSQPALSL